MDEKNPNSKTESVEFRVTEREKEFLRQEAQRRGIKISLLIRQALRIMFGWGPK